MSKKYFSWCSLCLVDSAKRKITFASAGHLPPLYIDSSGSEFLHTDAGLPLGVKECEFSEREIPMPVGSRLLLFTDGLTEAVNSSLEEYGPRRIRDHVVGQTATVESLLSDVGRFTSGYPAADDVTVVMIAATADTRS